MTVFHNDLTAAAIVSARDAHITMTSLLACRPMTKYHVYHTMMAELITMQSLLQQVYTRDNVTTALTYSPIKRDMYMYLFPFCVTFAMSKEL